MLRLIRLIRERREASRRRAAEAHAKGLCRYCMERPVDSVAYQMCAECWGERSAAP